jgi:methionyl-tRNA synthetase
MRIRPEERDTNFSWREFHRIVNTELNDNIGNLVHRVLSFIKRYFDSTVPEPGEFDETDKETWSMIDQNYREYIDLMLRFKPKQALDRILEIGKIGNQYLNKRAPWDEIKRDKLRASTTMYVAVNITTIIMLLMYPFTPRASGRYWRLFDLKHDIEEIVLPRKAFYSIEPGTRIIGEVAPIFTKLPEDFVEKVQKEILPKIRERIQEKRPESLRF